MSKTKTKPVEYEIEKCLVASTGHVTVGDKDLLESDAECKHNNELGTLLVYGYPEGFFVYCSSDADMFEDDCDEATLLGYSKDLIALMKLARRKRCKWLHLDCDGPIYDHLPTFDW